MTLSELATVLRNEEADAAAWRTEATRLRERGERGAALLAAVRAVGRGGDRRISDELLAAVPPRDEAARREVTQRTNAVIHNIKRFGGGADKVASAALDAIFDGGDPTYLLRAIAQTLDQLYASTAALDVIRGALALAPPDRGWYEDTHALVLLSLARWDEAHAAIERLAAIDGGQAGWLRSYLTALRQPFAHWSEKLFDHIADDAQTTTRSLAEVQAAASAIAARLAACRAALVELVGEAAWLPPVAALEPVPGSDDDYDVDDKRGSVPNLVLEARREWTRLVWLLVSAGSRELRVPQALAPCPQPLDYLDTMLSVLFNLLADRMNDAPFEPQDDLDRRMATSRWGGAEGTLLPELAPHLARIWQDETSAALAAVRWAAGSIDDVFEDP